MLYRVDAVETHIERKIKQLQLENALLKDWIREGLESRKCVVCGTQIENVSIQRMLRPYLWCSRECFQEKPRKIINLEHTFGEDIVQILKNTTRRYGNIKAQCGALGISIPYFYSIVEKYCGDDYILFMANSAAGKRKETYAKKLKKYRSKDQDLSGVKLNVKMPK